MSTITLENITYIYNKGTPYATTALDHIDLTIASDGITGLIGHTGSGKSTLVRLFNGLIKPTEGTVSIDGVNIWDEPKKIRNIRFKAGLVMQYPEYQLFAETVEEDIAFGPRNMGLDGDELQERILDAVRFSGLSPDLLKKSPFELSGGQKRRVALAGVIAMRPKILILDEPAAGLDPGGRRDILGKIKLYARESGTNVIIVSHSMEDMAMYCDDLVVMAGGKIIMHAPTAEVFTRYTELLEVGLDVPQVTRIAAALAKEGVDIGRDIYTVNYAADLLNAVIRSNKST